MKYSRDIFKYFNPKNEVKLFTQTCGKLMSIAHCLIIYAMISSFLWSGDQEKLRIKLATLAPKGSVWTLALQEMGQRWAKETDGFIKLVIYPGGVAGDESHVVRKMRIGQFDAATLTTVGLSRIDMAITAFSHIPLLYQNYDELDYVREKLGDEISMQLRAAGFVVIHWGDAGWVHFFTQTPMTRPEELKGMKLFVWSNESSDYSLWVKMGFHPVPLAATDISMGLNTGMINAFDTTPIAALSNQWFPFANHMADMKWAPLVGATVIKVETWEKIPVEYQKVMLQIAKEIEKKLMYETRSLNQKAIDTMQEHGLTVHHVDSTDYGIWEELVKSIYPEIRGKFVPNVYFDKAVNLTNEYRLKVSKEDNSP